MANKWMQRLQKMDGVAKEKRDPFAKVIRTFSPSANYVYGKTHGLPLGYTTVLYGPPKGGKSVLSHMMMGWLHQTDPEAIAIKIDTEYRADAQLNSEACKMYGIDEERLLVMKTNSPAKIFDQIEGHVAALCAQGAPIKLIVIDSISGVQGRREQKTESVEDHTIGDHAQTIQIGLKRILPVIRDYNIALVIITQVRAEMDPVEVKRKKKFKMQASFGLRHMAEYFVEVQRDYNAAGRKDLNKKDLVNAGVVDFAGKNEVVALKINVKMAESSMGPQGRMGKFTFHLGEGLINVHEEVFLLGKQYGILSEPESGNGFIFGTEKFRGKDHLLEELKQRPELRDAVVAELQRRDLAGEFSKLDASAASDEDGLGESEYEEEE